MAEEVIKLGASIDAALHSIGEARGTIDAHLKRLNRMGVVKTGSVFNNIVLGGNMMQRAIRDLRLSDYFGLPYIAHPEPYEAGLRNALRVAIGRRN